MRKALILCGVILAAAATPQALGQDRASIDHARRIVDLLTAGRFEDVTKAFNPQMAGLLSAAQLGDVWSGLSRQAGAFQSVLDERVTSQGGMTVVVLGCQFEKAAMNVIIAFDSEARIGGLRMVPRPAAAETPTPPPASSRFREEPVTVGSGEWALPGTLSLPAGRVIAGVVLVHGSGPNDRDETVGPNKPFRDLAWGLADRGIAVLRYEKRTRQHGAKLGASGDTRYTVRQEVTEDAVLAATLLRSRKEIDPATVFVLGHSLGGTLAPRIAVDDPALAGIIIMAGATRPLIEVAREQLAYLASLNPALNADAALKALQQAAPVSYWADLDAYKPAQVAAMLRRPMLILHGDRDYQVSRADLDGWRQALGGRSDVTIKNYPALNHLFMAGEGKATPAEYERPGAVAPGVIDDIAAWLTAIVRK